ncbi:MAG: pantoate--beta-alanine ligase [Syntrophobacterales bacterium]|jgi:pantoate--beta-alanine ligase|nr:pantoate--beta-alanine ligase [Syntrophobacterales bacterium]
MKIVKTVKEMQTLADGLRKEKLIGFVPTMGYLHEGHLALVRKARELGDIVVVSIFVNPIQFGPTEDLSRYPRDFDRDAGLLIREKTDIIFFPEAHDIYPEGYSTYIEVKGLEDYLCGKTRTGHFLGVATVVNKLFNIVKPHFAVFGQKDFQQLRIIEKMIRDLNMDITIVPHPTVREKDGLAMSSRNTYLSPEERARALRIYASIKRAEEMFREGERDVSVLREEVIRLLGSGDGVDIEYVSFSDADTLRELDKIESKALLAIACRVGKTRLIDNINLMEA